MVPCLCEVCGPYKEVDGVGVGVCGFTLQRLSRLDGLESQRLRRGLIVRVVGVRPTARGAVAKYSLWVEALGLEVESLHVAEDTQDGDMVVSADMEWYAVGEGGK